MRGVENGGLKRGKRNWIPNYRAISCAVISLVMLASGYAQSPAPAPSDGKEKQHETQKPKEAEKRPESAKPSAEPVVPVRKAEPPVVKLSTEEPKKQADPKPLQWGSIAEWATALVAAVAVFIAWWQLGYFREQLGKMDATLRDSQQASQIAERAAKATEASVEAMRLSDERQLRAYVSINMEWGDLTPSASAPFGFQFALVNHGRSPAKEVGYRAIATCINLPVTDRPELTMLDGPWNEKRMNLFPFGNSEKSGKMNCRMDWYLGQDRMTALQAEAMGLLIGIEVQYLDVFGPVPHITRDYFLWTTRGILTVPDGSYLS